MRNTRPWLTALPAFLRRPQVLAGAVLLQLGTCFFDSEMALEQSLLTLSDGISSSIIATVLGTLLGIESTGGFGF